MIFCLKVALFQRLMVDRAVVSKADVIGRDGVVHVVDALLIPPTFTVGEFLLKVENFTMFTAALQNVSNITLFFFQDLIPK